MTEYKITEAIRKAKIKAKEIEKNYIEKHGEEEWNKIKATQKRKKQIAINDIL